MCRRASPEMIHSGRAVARNPTPGSRSARVAEGSEPAATTAAQAGGGSPDRTQQYPDRPSIHPDTGARQRSCRPMRLAVVVLPEPGNPHNRIRVDRPRPVIPCLPPSASRFQQGGVRGRCGPATASDSDGLLVAVTATVWFLPYESTGMVPRARRLRQTICRPASDGPRGRDAVPEREMDLLIPSVTVPAPPGGRSGTFTRPEHHGDTCCSGTEAMLDRRPR
jgi:hypothetical protein